MTLGRESLVMILQAALDEPIGLVLRTSDATRSRAALYKARADSGDSRLSILQIRLWPSEEGDIIICHPAETKPGPRPIVPDLGDLLDE